MYLRVAESSALTLRKRPAPEAIADMSSWRADSGLRRNTEFDERERSTHTMKSIIDSHEYSA